MSIAAEPWVDWLVSPGVRRARRATLAIAVTLLGAAGFGSTPAVAGHVDGSGIQASGLGFAASSPSENGATGAGRTSSPVAVAFANIQIVKTASPLSRVAPGGQFTFSLVISNPGSTAITITSLIDNVYGNLGSTSNPSVTNNTCAARIGVTLAANGSTTCTFVGTFTGFAGTTETDVVTVAGTDAGGNTATDSDDAVVVLVPAPQIQIVKTVTPGTRPAPGGQFTFSLVISNPGPSALTIADLVDDIYGDLSNPGNPYVSNNTCDELIGGTLAANGASATCTFVGSFTGVAGDREFDTVTVIGWDVNGYSASDNDDAVVTLVPAPVIQIVKTVTPGTLPAPGGQFTFSLVISNPGSITITIADLVDDIYGNLGNPANPGVSNNTCDDLIGDVLAPSASIGCTFLGQFVGAAGDTETDVVTVFGIDQNGFTATDSDDAVVQLTPAPTDGADFNGDGFADLAVGVPDEDVGRVANAGAVNVLYGSGSGLTGASSQLWHQNSASVIDTAEADDHFGAAVASGDLDNDGFDDLAVGVPGEDVGTVGDGGLVHVLYGSAAGLSATGSQTWSQDSAGIVNGAETGDGFGATLAIGDLNTAAGHDLAIGVPAEDVGAIADGGLVHVLYGTAAGLSATGSQSWAQDTSGVADSAETGDRFGATLAIGDLNNAAGQDLAIGAPSEDVGSVVDAGLVHVLYGSAAGVTATGSQAWSQDSAGVMDSAETGDGFGATLAIGDLNTAAGQDLAIGVPAEDVGAIAGAGVAHVLYGSAAGLTATGSQYWSQDSAGIVNSAETGDGFGATLAIGNLNTAAGEDLAIGVPAEDVGAIADGGLVHVLSGSAAGLTATGSQSWAQDTGGVADSAETGDRFGATLAIGDLNNAAGQDLAIGVPAEDVGAIAGAGIAHVLYGSAAGLTATGSQAWSQNSAGVGDSVETGDGFGDSLGSG